MFSKRSIVWRVVIIVLALADLYVGGWAIDQLELDVWSDRTFFQLRFEFLAECPFWFMAGLVVLVANGLFLLRWAVIEGGITTPTDGWWPSSTSKYEMNVPLPTLKVLGLNLLLLPTIWFTYILITSIGS